MKYRAQYCRKVYARAHRRRQPSLILVSVVLRIGVGQEALRAVQEVASRGGEKEPELRLETQSTPLQKRLRMADEKIVSVVGITPEDPTPAEPLPRAESSPGTRGGKDVPSRSKRRRKHRGSRNPPLTSGSVNNVTADEQDSSRISTPLPMAAMGNSSPDLPALAEELVMLRALAKRSKGLFEWVDGPLVSAMRNGELVLLDELSLADDAVLERLNSVLEPGRSITLAEKGGQRSEEGLTAETVIAAPGFRYSKGPSIA